MKITFIFAFLFILSIRYAYQVNNPLYFYFPDSYQYLNRAQEIAQGKPYVNPFRLPLYPIILKETLHLDGKTKFDAGTINWLSYQSLINFQIIIGIIGALCFVFITRKLFGNGWLFLAISAIFALNVHIFAWDKNLLTESITAASILILFFILVRFIDSYNILYLFLVVILAIILFFLRPVYFLLSFSILPFLLFFFLRRKSYIIAAITTIFLLLPLLVPLFYSWENKRLYGYNGITTVSDHNLLAKVIQYQLPTKGIPLSNDYEKRLAACVISHKPNEWVVMDDCVAMLNLADNDYSTKSAPIIGAFSKKVIINNLPSYIVKSLRLFPKALVQTEVDPFLFISTYAYSPTFKQLWDFAFKFFKLFQLSMLGFFIFYPIHLYRFLQSPTKTNTILVILGTSVLYLLFFNTFFVQGEYARLRNPIESALYLFCLYYYVFFIKSLQEKLPMQYTLKKHHRAYEK